MLQNIIAVGSIVIALGALAAACWGHLDAGAQGMAIGIASSIAGGFVGVLTGKRIAEASVTAPAADSAGEGQGS